MEVMRTVWKDERREMGDVGTQVLNYKQVEDEEKRRELRCPLPPSKGTTFKNLNLMTTDWLPRLRTLILSHLVGEQFPAEHKAKYVKRFR